MIGKIQKLKNKKGFTLVELIVVIAIIAILTAVIVPLVGRYSAQARYTTLQDAAQTIANSANSAITDANQIGVITTTTIYGAKGTDGKLAITFSGGTGSADIDKGIIAATDTAQEAASGDSAYARAAKRLHSSLLNALPNNCSFYVSITNSSVDGVIYSATSSTTISSSNTNSIDKSKIGFVKGFDKAYAYMNSGDTQAEAKGDAVGVSGSFIPKTASTP